MLQLLWQGRTTLTVGQRSADHIFPRLNELSPWVLVMPRHTKNKISFMNTHMCKTTKAILYGKQGIIITKQINTIIQCHSSYDRVLHTGHKKTFLMQI